MILLDYHNRIIEDTLKARFNPENKPKLVDMSIVDFDGVSYHISTLENQETKLLLSIRWKCWPELIQYGAESVLKREYSQWITQPEVGYDFSLLFDLENIGADPEDVIRKVSLLKRNAMAAPFERAFDAQALAEKEEQWDPTTSQLMTIHYREGESIFIQNQQDRVTVIFSTLFKEETDRIFGKVFLQEFVDARRKPHLQHAPQVIYSHREPPLEIRHLPGLEDSESMGYITFVLFPRHFVSGQVREETISRIQIFRDYLHYHIKCSKAYMHSRMRARVSDFLKVLNRAKPEHHAVEKKLASGRAFRRT
ncbi:hypothetical protein DFQ27_004033 [Actinomortierella ambigua]|uniref:Arp2/3 complex 34 kDa subunit n=1 Tax=Actinomortierella ambigua TaxID=1343610 RepID=A0A9P6Q674_9FUNG|nr:hypothetical protein DFQ26_001913 [Actinomortierella ambigua]KAG0259519.1 hypothetical protein DFQ27_004033 [Actinomortierella ambigua]